MKPILIKRNEEGLTLVEIVASIVLLMILLTIFINFLNQSAKTNKVSQGTVNATYIAQTEIEKLYQKSEDYFYSERAPLLDSYELIGNENEWELWTKSEADFEFTLKLQQTDEFDHLSHVVLEVKHKDDSKENALMQHIFTWKEEIHEEP
ncbi:MAG TPA: hypothetical protein VIG73_07360 [Cerasibacillus sp.]|uniref:type IV pilus modification PilV family protein n=1 Tax=Cerasibacillus sp. TaxID=2498711 RepID=UPI002F3F3CF7